MKESITKSEILKNIQSERVLLEKIIAELSPAKMLEPNLDGNWSVKDVLAHIAEWETLMAQWTKESLRGETPNRPGPGSNWDDLDQFNESLYEKNKDCILEDVLQEFHSSYQSMFELIVSVGDEDLVNPHQFEWREGVPLWHMVAGNTWWHYKEHRESIEQLLAAEKPAE